VNYSTVPFLSLNHVTLILLRDQEGQGPIDWFIIIMCGKAKISKTNKVKESSQSPDTNLFECHILVKLYD
jgi:hypothetical protein